MDKIKYVDFDMWTDIQTPLKNSQHTKVDNSHKEHILSLIEKYGYDEKKPSPYYPIVADAWERFTNGR